MAQRGQMKWRSTTILQQSPVFNFHLSGDKPMLFSLCSLKRIGTEVKMLLGMPASRIGVSGFESQLCSQFQLLADVFAGKKKQMMAQIFRFLPPMWRTQIGFLSSTFSLLHFKLLWAFVSLSISHISQTNVLLWPYHLEWEGESWSWLM